MRQRSAVVSAFVEGLCCHSYLSDFVPVSIKMAKEQNLSLNPTKISGVCGRLMCCLKMRKTLYEELNRKLPVWVTMSRRQTDCTARYRASNVLRQLVKVLVEVGDEKELKEYEADTLQFKRRRAKGRSGTVQGRTEGTREVRGDRGEGRSGRTRRKTCGAASGPQRAEN